MSFADDYKEIQRFEQVLMSGGDLSYDLSGFTQFVFDNADFNVATLTGHNILPQYRWHSLCNLTWQCE